MAFVNACFGSLSGLEQPCEIARSTPSHIAAGLPMVLYHLQNRVATVDDCNQLARLRPKTFAWRHGERGWTALWFAIIRWMLSVDTNRGPVFRSLRIICTRMTTICNNDPLSYTATLPLPLLFCQLALFYGASNDDLQFFLCTLKRIEAPTGKLDIYSSINQTCDILLQV